MNNKQMKEDIDRAFSNFKEALAAHNDITIKRRDGGWSVMEIGAHIIKSTGADYGRTAKTTRPYDQHATEIKNLFLNFELKFPAAPALQPDGTQFTLKELNAALDNNQSQLNKMIDDSDLTETCIDIELPGWGALTKFEWLVLIENHVIRHTKQVREFNEY